MTVTDIRDRVVRLVKVKASSLRPSPWNFRIHPERQKQLLREVFGEVGIAGAVIARQLDDGSYSVIDGHLRREEMGDKKIPVLVTDLTEEEAKLLLATYDPIASWAETDKDAYASLVREVETKGQVIASLFSEMTEGSEVLDEDELQLEVDDSDDSTEEPDVDDVESTPLQMSHVRMVQLYCTASNIEEFENMAAEAGRMFGTNNLTDTIFAVLREVISKASGKTKKKNSEKM